MKTTLITTLLLSAVFAGIANAQDELTLRYGFDFEGGEGTINGMGGYNVNNSALEENQGTGTYSNIYGYRNYGANGGVEGTWSARQNNGNMQINGMNMSSSDGITIAMAYNPSNQKWANLFGSDLTGSNQVITTTDSASGLNMYYTTGSAIQVNGASATDLNALVMTAKHDGTNTLVSISVYSPIGELIGSSDTSLLGELTMDTFFLGAGVAGSLNSKDTHIDNVLIYEGAADENQSLFIANTLLTTANIAADSALQVLIPEPATATLSLLALAGFMARRRRK